VYLTPLSGIDLLTRADPLGITLALAAASIAVLALAERDREPVEAAALLVTASGAIVAVVAGNAIVLFAGMELANLGTALALSAGRRRPGRGATAGLAVQHLGALGVLASAALLQTRSGTTDFIALPPGAVTAAAGIPWALGGAIR